MNRLWKCFLLLSCLICFITTTVIAHNWDSKLTQPKPGTVALTFDDGPNPKATPQILKILRKYHIHATFFVIGKYAKKYPDIVKQIYQDGNVVASHSMTHTRFIGMSQNNLRYEVVGSRKFLQKLIGAPVKCMRAPYNEYNKQVINYIKQKGIAIVPEGLISFDYEQPGVAKIADCTVYHARSGYIISLHDGPIEQNRKQTIKALPKIIEGIRKRGLDFSTICN